MLKLQRVPFNTIVPAVSILLAVVLSYQVALAGDSNKATVAAGGYDVVSYHSKQGPVPGTGWHTAEHDGVVYLFASKKNKNTFLKNPAQYIPAYGGYCAYGVAVGKKFYIDPLSWHIKDGILYLNLDQKIQKKWLKDVPGYIEKADENWKKIKDTPVNEL